ncbi:MAG: hypothetical protein H0V07_08175 [Propionibacteriales bacterium]|nr:hypothetical protein [Propionibacteriales bacterium]
MADKKRVFIHIGAPKTGTTFLQRVLKQNSEAMAQAGVLYPKLRHEAHHTAVWALRKTFDDTDKGAAFANHWDRLVRQSRGWTGDTVVISSELFCFSRGPTLTKVLTAFGDAEVHVVYTARDLIRQVPAVWQEQVKNRQDMPYQDFLADVLGDSTSALSRLFWGGQNARAVLARWSKRLDHAHVHVVTAPPPGSPPGLLWERFASVVGLDAARYASDIPPANTSLSITAAESLRRYNARFAEDLPILEYRKIIRRQLDPAFAHTLRDSSKFPLTMAQRSRIHELSEQMVDGVRRGGYDVVGSLDDLAPAPRHGDDSTPGGGPDSLSDTQIMEALLDVVNYLLRRPG